MSVLATIDINNTTARCLLVLFDLSVSSVLRAIVRVLETLDIMQPCTVLCMCMCMCRSLYSCADCEQSGWSVLNQIRCVLAIGPFSNRVPGPGTAGPEKKHLFVLFVLLAMEEDIVPSELATKQAVVLQGSICSSPQRSKDFHLFHVNSENASHSSSVPLCKLCSS